MRQPTGFVQIGPLAAPCAVLVLALALALAGCSSGGAAESAGALAPTDGAGPRATAPRSATVPAGTVFAVEFAETVSSETAAAGDRFSARVLDSLTVDGDVAVRSGDTVVGTVVEAVPTKKIGGRASLELTFDALHLPDGRVVPLSAAFTEQGRKQTGKDAATIGGATAGGAILGRIIGHERGDEADGTAIGAVVGAAVGTAIAATNERDPVVIPEGTVLEVSLRTPLEVPVS